MYTIWEGDVQSLTVILMLTVIYDEWLSRHYANPIPIYISPPYISLYTNKYTENA